MSVLSTGLETITYGQPGWSYIVSRNAEILNAKLLKISALLDVLLTNIQDEQTLVWDSVAGKFKNRSF